MKTKTTPRGLIAPAWKIPGLLDGRVTQWRVPIAPSNCTVLGYPVTAKSKLWQELDWGGVRIWQELDWGGVRKDGGTHFFNPNGGEYLHVRVQYDPNSDGVVDILEHRRWYRVRCRHQLGDRLFVKETWQRFSNGNPDAQSLWSGNRQDVFYRADESDPASAPLSGRWRSPAIMPAWAARIWLEIESVRVERVQEISEADAQAEGIKQSERTGGYIPGNCAYARWAFEIVWNFRHPGSWDRNDWVWCLSFRRVEAS